MPSFSTVDATQDEVAVMAVIDPVPYQTLITPAPDNTGFSADSSGGTQGTRVSGDS